MESRTIADNIKNTLTVCSLENLADASLYLTSEMIEVVKCVLDGKGTHEAITE